MADKALLLGINKYKKVGSLRGCVNDVKNMQKLLTEVYNFDSSNIQTLLDENVVKGNVLPLMNWLLKDAQAGDRLVLHFSGHGSQITDLDGDEREGYDELICLHDMDFRDSNTYLLDDELRRWTQGLTPGAELTIVFDSCHSGSGTRMLLSPDTSRSAQPTFVMVDVETSAARAVSSGSRSLAAHEVVDAVTKADSPEAVRLRFVDPPPDIKQAIERRKLAGRRGGVVVAEMNHVLLAGCRDDQESADAHIDNDFNDAFTYHLCKTIRAGGASIDRNELITRVERAMFEARFSQSPQLEGPTLQGPLFGKSNRVPSGPTTVAPPKVSMPDDPITNSETDSQSSGSSGVSTDDLLRLLPSIALLAPAAQVEAIKLLRATTAGPARLAAPETRQVGGRQLVYVHGICQHVKGYSNDWWSALQPHTNEFGQGNLGQQRHEVLWSDLVNTRDVGMAEGALSREAGQRADAKLSLIEAMQDRIDRQVVESESPRGVAGDLPVLEGSRGLSVPFVNCLDDFTVYMVNSSMRVQILKRFTDVVRPLLRGGAEIDIIAHSWGTVVAYEGLRELAEEGTSSGHVRNLITVGAALSLAPVKAAMRAANKDGKRPRNVSRWVNVNARGDIVGGVLKDRPYEVDFDFPNAVPTNCTTIFGRAVNPACAHRSYFLPANLAVNKDIFANYINRA